MRNAGDGVPGGSSGRRQRAAEPPAAARPAGNGGAFGKLDMSSQDTAYANLVDVPAAGSECAGKGRRVTPSNSATSILYLKISPTDPSPCGSKMPLGGVALPQNEIEQIASWINAGAMNN